MLTDGVSGGHAKVNALEGDHAESVEVDLLNSFVTSSRDAADEP
jgi:hypothetical protein